MQLLRRVWQQKTARYAFGIIAGAAAGFAYYWYVGCPTGGCPISSNPYLMLAMGGFLGYTLVADTPKERR